MAYVNLLDIIYPVGSIYFTISNVSPSQTLGGTWVQIKNKFVRASNGVEALVNGGQDSVKVTTEYLPDNIFYASYASALTNEFKNIPGMSAAWNAIQLTFSTGSYAWSYSRKKGSDGNTLSYFHNLPTIPAYTTAHIWYRTA